MADIYRIPNLNTGAVYHVEASSPRVALGRVFKYRDEARAINPGNDGEVIISYAVKNLGPATYAWRVQATDDTQRQRAQRWSASPPSFRDWYTREVHRTDQIADPIAQGYTVAPGTTRKAAERAALQQAERMFADDPTAAAAIEAWQADRRTEREIFSRLAINPARLTR